MTFSELMQVTYHMQTVMLVLGEGESITGNAEAIVQLIADGCHKKNRTTISATITF